MQEQDRSDQQKPERPEKAGGGAAALVDWVRSLPDRLKRPETLLMLMAILASLGAHMPPYISLGALADYFKAHPPMKAAAPPVEVSFEVNAPSEPKEEDPEPEQPAPEEPKKKPKKAIKPPEKLAKLEPEKKKKPEPEPPKPELKVSEVTVQPPPPPPPPPALERKQSVTQKSEDPNVEPPPDAKFLAEESRRVEEETVAMLRDQNHDDPQPNAAAPQAAGAEEPGDAKDDQRGEQKGADKPEPAEPGPQKPALAMREPSAPPPPPDTARPSPTRPAQPTQAPAPAIAPGTVIQDPLGSFVLAPANPSQRSQGSQRAVSATDAARANPANLKVSWRAFEDTFGAEQLEKDRMPPGAKRRGAGREKKWAEFRAAIENYITGVKPGNTTALNAAADPFAAYLAAFHRNLHMEFAHEFLASLPLVGELGSADLVTKVEIVVNPDGTLDRVGIVKTSGNTMYDFGAFNAVQRGAPYPPPPEKIRSPDGRAYFHWALHRNESQCGTWNAEPYILRDPPRSPNDPPEDNVPPFRKQLLGPQEEGSHGRAPRPSRPGGATLPGETLGLAPLNRPRVQG